VNALGRYSRRWVDHSGYPPPNKAVSKLYYYTLRYNNILHNFASDNNIR
jgi:hypothetical protein